MALRIHHLTLTVNDVDVSAQWYQRLLGEADVVQREMLEFRRVRMSWPDGLIIGVTQFKGTAAPDLFSPERVGLDHVGLACESPDEVRKWAQRITDLGYTRGPVEEAPYGWAVTSRDPDNIPVEFFCPA